MTKGEYPLGHTSPPMKFGTSNNYHTEFLRFELARFNYAYNAIIGRPGLAKFMVVPHYSYMMLKMSGMQGIITVRLTSRPPRSATKGLSRRLSLQAPRYHRSG